MLVVDELLNQAIFSRELVQGLANLFEALVDQLEAHVAVLLRFVVVVVVRARPVRHR